MKNKQFEKLITTRHDREKFRENLIKFSNYERSDTMDIIRNMQKCQRNWDYSREVSKEVIDYLLWIAKNSPSKQYEAYYDVYWSADRDIIQKMSRYTWGCTHSRNPPSTWRNSQANANMYMLFVAKEPETQENCHADGTPKENSDINRWENAYVSVGIAMGLVMHAAQRMNLVTGCNKSHRDLNGDMFWERKLGIEEDVLAGRKKIAYGIGIGYPQEDRPRWESDEKELAIGAGNGSKLTTDPNMEVHPVTGKPMRKVKIVDIRTTNEAVDPYGNTHQIPHTSDIKINTQKNRVINIIEIK
jgi:nitroreductase